MDKRLQIVHRLYEEGADRTELRRLLQEDAASWEEYQALSEVKFELDHRPRHRPDARVLDGIMAAAAAPHAVRPEAPRRDRKALPRQGRGRYRAMGLVGVTLGLVLVVGIGVWRTPAPPAVDLAADRSRAEQTAPLAEQSAPAAAPPQEPAGSQKAAEAATEAAPEARAPMGRLAAREASARPAADAAAAGKQEVLEARTQAEILAWDASEEVIALHRRIERLQDSVQLGWDEPAVPLEMMPPPDAETPWATPGLQQVSRKAGQ